MYKPASSPDACGQGPVVASTQRIQLMQGHPPRQGPLASSRAGPRLQSLKGLPSELLETHGAMPALLVCLANRLQQLSLLSGLHRLRTLAGSKQQMSAAQVQILHRHLVSQAGSCQVCSRGSIACRVWVDVWPLALRRQSHAHDVQVLHK